jgi:hypothetical protein
LIGGPYLHLGQIAAAVPAAILLAARAPQMRMMPVYVAVLLAIPWQKVAIFPLLVPCAALVTALLVWELSARNLETVMRAVLASAILGGLIGVATVLIASQNHVPARAPEVVIDASLAQASWSNDVREHNSNGSVAMLAAKAPTWLGLGLALFAFISVASATNGAAFHRAELILSESSP